MRNRLLNITRIVCGISAVALATVIFLPIWRIDLTAPQYPEGLFMQIFANKLGGNVEIINGLNHYIGMSQIHEKDFVEFQVLPYIIGLLAVFGILTLIINRKWFFYAWFIFFSMFGIVAMMDFYRWEYNYGHNLSPTAPIQVPGMAYQPPLIGYKQLLNFGAYSMPDIGGWIFIVVAVLLIICGWLELRSFIKQPVKSPALLLILVTCFSLSGCTSGPAEIPYGKAACEHCKMTILDKKFGAEMVTPKGKIFYFDDLQCLVTYRKSNPDKAIEKASVYLSDYSGDPQLILANRAFFVKSESIHGPMGGQIAAFLHATDREAFMNIEPKAIVVDWQTIIQP
jgi:copper chaperone NosL